MSYYHKAMHERALFCLLQWEGSSTPCPSNPFENFHLGLLHNLSEVEAWKAA